MLSRDERRAGHGPSTTGSRPRGDPSTESRSDHEREADGRGRDRERRRRLERRRLPAPRRDDHGERDEPDERERRARERHDDEQQREVVQPHDRREQERSGEREDERLAFAPAASRDHDARENGDPHREPERARNRRRRTCVERHHVEGVRVQLDDVLEAAEHVRVVREPREADRRPRAQHQHRSYEPRAATAASTPARRRHPDDERPQDQLDRQRRADRDGARNRYARGSARRAPHRVRGGS